MGDGLNTFLIQLLNHLYKNYINIFLTNEQIYNVQEYLLYYIVSVLKGTFQLKFFFRVDFYFIQQPNKIFLKLRY